MKRNTTFSLGLIALMAAFSCASMEWQYTEKPPIATGLAEASNVGVAPVVIKSSSPFMIYQSMSDQLIAGRTDIRPVNMEKLNAVVKPLDTSTREIINIADLGDDFEYLIRDVILAMIPLDRTFEANVMEGFTFYKVAGSNAEGLPLSASYDSVVPVDYKFMESDFKDSYPELPANISDLGLDVVISGVVDLKMATVEIVTPNADPEAFDSTPMDYTAGSYVCYIDAYLDYVIYDANTGVKLSDSFQDRVPFGTMKDIRSTSFLIPIRSVEELTPYLQGPEFKATVVEKVSEQFRDYVPALTHYYFAELVEVVEEEEVAVE